MKFAGMLEYWNIMKKAKINKITADLRLITLNPPIDGFENFISTWLYQGEICFLVDVGPASTADGLIQILDEANVDRLDYILLTLLRQANWLSQTTFSHTILPAFFRH